MDNPTQLLHSQLCLRMRNQGTLRQRFKDVAKRNMKSTERHRSQPLVESANERSDYDKPYSLKSVLVASADRRLMMICHSNVLYLDFT